MSRTAIHFDGDVDDGDDDGDDNVDGNDDDDDDGGDGGETAVAKSVSWPSPSSLPVPSVPLPLSLLLPVLSPLPLVPSLTSLSE